MAIKICKEMMPSNRNIIVFSEGAITGLTGSVLSTTNPVGWGCIKVHDWPDENRIGPLLEKEFQAKRKELKIPDNLTFTGTFKKLE
ncbi:MAG: hypothetical protein LBF89_06550 [Bacteroidales bacterium]|jgi:hypothetical protein|nr:hypothetical protein [Bacteroidales bacterium]